MYGDSCENLFEIWAVEIILSAISSVVGAQLGSKKRRVCTLCVYGPLVASNQLEGLDVRDSRKKQIFWKWLTLIFPECQVFWSLGKIRTTNC